MNKEIKIHDKIAKVKIPFRTKENQPEIVEVYAHIIEYDGNIYTQHSMGSMDNPNDIIPYVFSDFRTGYKIKAVDLFVYELTGLYSKEATFRTIHELFEKYVIPVIEANKERYEEMSSRLTVLNTEIIYDNGPTQEALDNCQKEERE